MMAYDGADGFFASIPVNPVDLLVVGADVSEQALTRITRWTRRCWPRCMTVCLGRPGETRQEATARQTGAMYFASPVPPVQWNAVLEGADACRSVRLKTA
ncbi:MAG: hypothetical protein GVY16_02395 [Planctomycetes bacterium]|nr:hypothetical protein [Planctomycetota bacterium]